MNQISLESPASALSILNDYPTTQANIAIRPLALNDAQNIFAAVQESLPELRQFMPWAHLPQSLDNQRTRITTSIHKYWTGQDFPLGIYEAKTNRFLGGTGLHPRTLNSKGFEIGYWIRSTEAGRGLATLVTRSLIVYGFEYLKLTRIQCGHNTNNLASGRVNDKCGFKIEGKFRNFEAPPTTEMIQNGWVGSNETTIRGLCPEDIPNLAWYKDLCSRLTVYDWLGQKVPLSDIH